MRIRVRHAPGGLALFRLGARHLHDLRELPGFGGEEAGEFRRRATSRIHTILGEAFLDLRIIEDLAQGAVQLVHPRRRYAGGREHAQPGAVLEARISLGQRQNVGPVLQAFRRGHGK